MKSHLKIALIPLLGLLAFPVSAQDCDNHHFILDFKSFAFLDEPIEPYDGCWEMRVVGTINGRYVGCAFFDEVCGPWGCSGRTSDEIWGDGWSSVAAWKTYAGYETGKGDLEVMEWTWLDRDSGMEAGVAKVIGGTGNFEGASGSLSVTSGYPNTGKYHVKGEICSE